MNIFVFVITKAIRKMISNIQTKLIFYVCLSAVFVLPSCFLIKIPLPVKSVAIQDTIHVYHFIIIDGAIKTDAFKINAIVKESKDACDWLTDQAENNGQKVYFKEHWMFNNDTSMGKTFAFRFPSKALTVLSKNKASLWKWAKQKTKNEEARARIMSWETRLLDTLVNSIADAEGIKYLNDIIADGKTDEQAICMMHLLKAKKTKIQGFYLNNRVYIGDNSSRTIAHETLHHLGANDLYIHSYWPGARRHLVKKKLKNEIMNFSNDKTKNCNNAFISSYTAYCMGWSNKLEKKQKRLLKQNMMSKILFRRSLK